MSEDIRHPREGGGPDSDWIPASAGMTAFCLFAVSFCVFTHFSAPSVTTGDSGEFMTAAATLSFAHPPAYPLYSLISKCFLTAVPFGSVPYRINLFSAFLSSWVLVLLFLLADELLKNKTQAILIAIAIGLTRSFFHNSLVTEVFALNTLFVCGILLALLRSEYLLSAFLIGLGVGNHQILVFMAPVLLFAAWKKIPIYRLALVGLIGFSVYAMLPIRAQKTPPLNWGEPTTIQRTWRIITRKDYGSLTLSIGEAPERTVHNQARQLKRLAEQMALEVPWWVLLLGFSGLVIGIYRREKSYSILLLSFLFAGPVFYVMGNLPFTAQSVGIMGRFMIWPVLLLMLGLCALLPMKRWMGTFALAAFILFLAPKRFVEGMEVRESRLVYDYGNAMLRTLPPHAILFMDGGDDAFYSLAMLHYVMGKRPDVELHDRGGLIYKNPYGSDFRSLTKDQKIIRRTEIEKSYVGRRPLFYSTLDPNVLPGQKATQIGFLYEIGSMAPRIDWPIVILRGLYPLMSADEYRVRALAAFFPYMQGLSTWDVAYFKHAARMGHDVDWLASNLNHTFSNAAYEKLMAKKLIESETLYREWLSFEPNEINANSNLGVVLEQEGRRAEARAQYQMTADKFPDAVDPVYNLGVMSWHDNDWASAARYFQETLRRNPNHPTAASFYARALMHMKEKP